MKHSNIAFFVLHLGCPHVCSFCDQRSISGASRQPQPQEVREVCGHALKHMTQQQRQNTEVAFFGGSFTAIDRETMLGLLEAAAPFCGAGKLAGIRISTRPDAVSEEILRLLRQYRVSAVELGAQSMDDHVLALNRRGHTAAQTIEASQLLRAYGFSLGLQMMTGLYGDSKESAYHTAEALIGCRPDTVRIYPTVVIRGTELCRLYEAGIYHPPGVDDTVPLAAQLMQKFVQAGIRVIRVGLHASRELEQNMVAGAYHPAFRELCEGELFYRGLLEKLEQLGMKEAEVAVNPRDVSRLVGQSRRNMLRLEQAGYRLRLRRDESLPERSLTVRTAERKDTVTICC